MMWTVVLNALLAHSADIDRRGLEPWNQYGMTRDTYLSELRRAIDVATAGEEKGR